MKFKFNHNNFNVLDLEKSIAFYEEALGLKVVNEFKAPDGSFILAYMGDGKTKHRLELTGFATGRKRTIWATMNSIWLSMSMIWMLRMSCTRRWDAFVSKTRLWAFISSMIRMVSGLKSSREENNGPHICTYCPHYG